MPLVGTNARKNWTDTHNEASGELVDFAGNQTNARHQALRCIPEDGGDFCQIEPSDL